MRSFTAGKNDEGRRLDKFILAAAPSMPKSLMCKYVRTKRIKVNGKRGDVSQRLCSGDVIDMYVSDEFFVRESERYDFLKAPSSLSIIYEDENIILLDKKAGVLSHPDEGEYVDTLITRVKRYLYEKGEYSPEKESSFAPALANRIDRNTGGIVIAAKNAEALRILNEKIKNREITKRYLCLVIGSPQPQSATVMAYMIKDEAKNRVKVLDRPEPGARTMITQYRVLESRDGLSLLLVTLHTGRTHQIRAHLAHMGYPLLGDGKYGSNALNKKYGGYKKQCLYSYMLSFDFKTDAGALEYLRGRSFTAESVWFKTAFERGELF